MKDLLINSTMKNIEKYYDYDDIRLAEIRYGLVSLYLQITKLTVIFILSYILGNIKTLLILMGLYSIIRLFTYGVHAKKSWHCWVSSLSIFLLIPYVCENYIIDFNIKIILSIISIILLGFFAPADSEKRPLINKKRRLKFKFMSIICGLIYLFLIFFIKNNVVSNCIMFSLILSAFVVLPITYKLFGVSYNNYKNYERELKGEV